jgi:hypothetical protein
VKANALHLQVVGPVRSAEIESSILGVLFVVFFSIVLRGDWRNVITIGQGDPALLFRIPKLLEINKEGHLQFKPAPLQHTRSQW